MAPLKARVPPRPKPATCVHGERAPAILPPSIDPIGMRLNKFTLRTEVKVDPRETHEKQTYDCQGGCSVIQLNSQPTINPKSASANSNCESVAWPAIATAPAPTDPKTGPPNAIRASIESVDRSRIRR